jgi:SAM-dependent methyltransferase
MTFGRSRDADATTRPPSRQDRWQLDGGIAEAYERYLVPVLFAPWAERLVQLAAPGPGERVLDVACGTGIVARRAVVRVGAGGVVAGLDLNQSTLEVARAAAAQAGASIDWRAGDVAGLPFPDGAFEIVFCQQGRSSSRTGRWRSARCAGCWFPGGGWRCPCGGPSSTARASPCSHRCWSITPARAPRP